MKTPTWKRHQSFTHAGFTVNLRYGKDDDGSGYMVWRCNIVRTAPPLHCGHSKGETARDAIKNAARNSKAFFARQASDSAKATELALAAFKEDEPNA